MYKKMDVYEKTGMGVKNIIAVSKVFQNGKTTIPKETRLKLGIEDGDRIIWFADEDGNITISRG